LVKEYLDEYEVAPTLLPKGEKHASLREGARIELGLRNFLTAGSFKAFTTTFEDLHGLAQLPGLAVQRLMRDGYGFGAEGDWKHPLGTCDEGDERRVEGGVSFMEDYTYHFSTSGDKCWARICLKFASRLRRQTQTGDLPLSIGGKSDPVRLIFDSNLGPRLARPLWIWGNASAWLPT